MTAVPPRPAAHLVGRCGNSSPSFIGAPPDICALPAGHLGWHRGDPQPTGNATEWSDAHPAAPDATAGDGLREALKLWLDDRAERFDAWSYPDDEAYADADAVLALPALRDVLAAATRDAEKVRLREFAEWVLSLTDDPPHRRTVTVEQIVQRAALACDPDLDGTP